MMNLPMLGVLLRVSKNMFSLPLPALVAMSGFASGGEASHLSVSWSPFVYTEATKAYA